MSAILHMSGVEKKKKRWRQRTVRKAHQPVHGPQEKPDPALVSFIWKPEVLVMRVFNAAMFMKTATWNLRRFWRQNWFEF